MSKIAIRKYILKSLLLLTFLIINPITLSDQNNNIDLTGIDISHYQGFIDWQKLKKFNLNFILIKSSEGEHYIDPDFNINLRNAIKSNVLFGIYHFYKPDSNVIRQAKLFLQNINTSINSSFTILPPVVDVELVSSNSNQLLKDLNLFLKTIELESGCRPIIYSGYQFWKTYLSTGFSEYNFWIAEYSSLNPFIIANNILFWQYAQSAEVPGIAGPVDLNKFKGNINDLYSLTCRKI